MLRFTFTLAEDVKKPRPFTREHRVEQHYRERVPYVGVNGTWLKPDVVLPLQGGPLFTEPAAHWLTYAPVEDMAESFVLVIAGVDTLRIDLPEHMDVLRERAYARWDRDTPEVLRFRKGRHALEELVKGPWCTEAADRLALRMIAADEAAYRKELVELAAYYRAQPPPVPPTNKEPPHTPTAEEIEREIAQRPGLQEVKVDSVVAGNVWVRISGRVMLTGGCGSGMPLYGVELRNDTGWVERIPFELEQMDCGLPWADWTDHPVMIPMAWWVRVNSREGAGELDPGNYRLVLMGANGQMKRTDAFVLE